MLSNVYYFFGIFILLSVVTQLLKFDKIFNIIDWYYKFERVTGNKPKKEEFRSESEREIFISRSILLSLEGFWIIFGFITNNWFIFLFIVIYSKLLNIIIDNVKYKFIIKYTYLKYYLIKVCLYTSMIINHFHLNLDLWKLFKDFLLAL